MLAPAGSPLALEAAIEGGADAVYLGGSAFNARMNAHNFGGDALRSAVLHAHSYGVKVYLTLNTLITDREIKSLLTAAEEAAEAGVDALITADLGAAAAIHRCIPTMELHASTQMSGHNASMARELAALGFSRMVIARETPAGELARAVQDSPIEIEAFVHGALCVSHSGQCLFSSLVGGRSGNRGECAQPCRLPYGGNKTNTYPLSLKDLSLAPHVPFLIASGISSFKIEGRMKSPEYVRDTVRIWRRLLDEKRGATGEEMRELAEIFSRGGFTDGYYREAIGRSMLGVRSENDKTASRQLTPFTGIEKKIPLTFSATLTGNEPIRLTVSDGAREITVTGDVPEAALNAPLSHQTLERNLSKLGGTPYTVEHFEAHVEEGLMLPISRINELRRNAIAKWEAERPASKKHERLPYAPLSPKEKRAPLRSAVFYSPRQITPTAESYFDRIYLPIDQESPRANGVLLPAVLFEKDLPTLSLRLAELKQKGVEYALVGNLGHLQAVREAGLSPVGDFRLNITNRETVCRLEQLGILSAVLSPELTLPQARDVGGNTALTVYGRIPLMTLEKCVIREIADCKTCGANKAVLCDRMGAKFPVLREWEHRNVVYNSLPTCMSDKQDTLKNAKLSAWHFIFSTEEPREVDRVIEAFKTQSPLGIPVRRV